MTESEEMLPKMLPGVVCRQMVRCAAIPGEAPLSGVCDGIQLLGLEDAQVRLKWRISGGVWCNRIGKGCRNSTSDAVPNVSFKHFGAYVERNVTAGHEKTARCCEENGLKENIAIADITASAME